MTRKRTPQDNVDFLAFVQNRPDLIKDQKLKELYFSKRKKKKTCSRKKKVNGSEL
jgi:hypothetical protein